MPYIFGIRSTQRLEGVHPNLVRVAKLAIMLTKTDFSVVCGLRTREEQAALVADGKSQTMQSKHIPQIDGYGHAIDIAPYIDKRLSWDKEHFFPVADAMRLAAVETGIPIRWGGSWIRPLNDSTSAQEAFGEYVALRKSQGRKPFIDMPHFEIYANRKE